MLLFKRMNSDPIEVIHNHKTHDFAMRPNVFIETIILDLDHFTETTDSGANSGSSSGANKDNISESSTSLEKKSNACNTYETV